MVRWALLGACVSALALVEGDARACGGCFHQPNPPPQEITVVTGHRMVFSISTTQTVLWDQVQYSGSPAEFAWVLPVLPGAVIQESRDEWFAALDAATQPVITAQPAAFYPAQSGGCFALGCGSASNGGTDNASGGGGAGAVQILSQGVVGPYDTVTLKSTDPNALTTWLTSQGFDIPATIAPTIDQYVAGGFDFIALRLRPQCGVNAMKPVRIVTPGADPTLPLRMVAAGAGANVDVLLWVLGEGRWRPQNFPEVTLPDSQLVWDNAQSTSNYESVATSLMGQQNGTSWLTEFAKPVSASVYYPSSYGTSSEPNPSLAQAYYAFCGGAAPTNGSSIVQPSPCLDAGPAPAADAGDSGDAGDSEDADGGADADAAGPASGSSSGSSSGGPPPVAGCDAFDDLSVALDGISPDSVWLTRMRASLPVRALATDLVLTAAEQTPVTNVHSAAQDRLLAQPSSAGSCESAVKRRDTFGSLTLLALTGAALAAMLRRRRPRR